MDRIPPPPDGERKIFKKKTCFLLSGNLQPTIWTYGGVWVFFFLDGWMDVKICFGQVLTHWQSDAKVTAVRRQLNLNVRSGSNQRSNN